MLSEIWLECNYVLRVIFVTWKNYQSISQSMSKDLRAHKQVLFHINLDTKVSAIKIKVAIS